MKLFVPVIAYGGNVTTEYMFAMMSFQQHLITNKINATFYPITFESLIARARNVTASAFLESDCDYLFFVDVDMSFSVDDFDKLLNAQKEVCIGAYPKKYHNAEKVRLVHQTTKFADTDPYGAETLYTDFSTEVRIAGQLEKCVEVDYGATGFMLIHRSALERIVKQRPELEYKNDIDGYSDIMRCFDFFKTGVVNNKYISEDYGFCQVHRECGGKIYCMTDVTLSHIGRKVFRGNMYEQSKLFG